MTMMEFEGRTEREAVARAAEELGSESFDVEILEKNSGFFGRSKVKIRVKPLTAIPDPLAIRTVSTKSKKAESRPKRKTSNAFSDELKVREESPSDSLLQEAVDFAEGILKKMGYPGKIKYKKREGAKIILEITTKFSNIIIGKKGKNLDALQLLVNIFFIRKIDEKTSWRIVFDIGGYRARQEESLIRTAQRTADKVLKSGSSQILGPMNPFERRIVHTTLGKHEKLITRSEGEGQYKRIKIMVKDDPYHQVHKHR